MIRRSRLPSGLRVVTEALPGVRSVTLGMWVGSGSRDESDAESGASHFLEHLLFKGTDDRTARDIAHSIESVGGEMNAFTTHEQTVFYVRVPDTHFALAFDILTDIVWHPAFRESDVESERQVILEEIGMRDDTPDDLVHERFEQAMFPEHPLGREVLGTEGGIKEMARDSIASYHAAHYQPSNIVFAAAGNLDHDDVLARADSQFPQRSTRRPDRRRPALRDTDTLVVTNRPTEQDHVVVGVRALPALDPDRYAFTVLNQALGGGMSSRLFQEIREERGLAYSVYSYRAAYEDTGFLAVYAGTAPERVRETLGVIDAEFDRLVTTGLTSDELDAAKGHIAGSLAMSLETSSSRMRRIGRSEQVEGEVPPIDDLVARVLAVTADAVARVVDREVRDAPRTLAVVGPHEPADFETVSRV
ncbi:MAG: M16 family metallopeptidase [Acidimicrobiia bacterium]